MRGLTVWIVGLLIVIAGLPLLAAPPKEATVSAPVATASSVSPVVVYYFHGDQRCRTCKQIESLTEETIRSRFAKELKSKLIEWRVVNFDQPENEHVIDDYGLVTQSVVLVEYRGGKQVRFKNLDKVWRLIRDATAFEAYVRDEIRAFLENVHD